MLSERAPQVLLVIAVVATALHFLGGGGGGEPEPESGRATAPAKAPPSSPEATGVAGYAAGPDAAGTSRDAGWKPVSPAGGGAGWPDPPRAVMAPGMLGAPTMPPVTGSATRAAASGALPHGALPPGGAAQANAQAPSTLAVADTRGPQVKVGGAASAAASKP